ncbi:MAG: hypothetical protein J6R94_05685 [Agathobacter sp.]|nr:hypothetical protein [Agathobacter sp.]
MAEKDKKKKKEKITYIDDGRTIADMSGLYQNRKFSSRGTTSPVSEIWKTYWNAVKMMFKPMLVVIGCIVVLYLVMYVLFTFM